MLCDGINDLKLRTSKHTGSELGHDPGVDNPDALKTFPFGVNADMILDKPSPNGRAFFIGKPLHSEALIKDNVLVKAFKIPHSLHMYQ